MTDSPATITRVIDPRLDYTRGREGYLAYTGAKNWEVYHIPASGYSNASITFANITSIGESRVYEDNFTISYDVSTVIVVPATNIDSVIQNNRINGIGLTMFPLHQVSSQVAINLNGQRLTSVPRDTLQARSRFWPQSALDSIQIDCPVIKSHTSATSDNNTPFYSDTGHPGNDIPNPNAITNNGCKGSNNIGLTFINVRADSEELPTVYTITATWHIEEPILCSPFNSNLFETYGKPIWNISSLEITYWMENINRMISMNMDIAMSITSMTTSISSPVLNFKVANTPTPPPATFVAPYYEYVPFLTEQTSSAPVAGQGEVTITSGVYTLSYIPQSIYVFMAHSRSTHSQFGAIADQQCMTTIEHVNITMGNNTQLFNTMN